MRRAAIKIGDRVDGELAAVVSDGIWLIDPDAGMDEQDDTVRKTAIDQSRLLCRIPIGNGMRFNDGKCDSEGRLWVGTMSVDHFTSEIDMEEPHF